MFRQVSRIITKANATAPTRFITSTASKQKAAQAMHMHPNSHAYAQTPSDMSVIGVGVFGVTMFGLCFWNGTSTASRIGSHNAQYAK